MNNSLARRIIVGDTLTLIENGSKAFKSAASMIFVLQGFSLAITSGRATAILGPNACGKSTVARILLGLEHLDAGTTPHELTSRDRMGAVLQDYRSQLLPWATVRDNCAIATGGASDSGQLAGVVDATLSYLGAFGYATITPDRIVGALSGGQQQALVLARALAFTPEIMVIDEGFAAIDWPKFRAVVQELRGSATQQRTLLFITHSPLDAALIADRILVFGATMNPLLAIDCWEGGDPQSEVDPDSPRVLRIADRVRHALLGDRAIQEGTRG